MSQVLEEIREQQHKGNGRVYDTLSKRNRLFFDFNDTNWWIIFSWEQKEPLLIASMRMHISSVLSKTGPRTRGPQSGSRARSFEIQWARWAH